MRLSLSNGIKEVDKMVETKVLNPKTREMRNRDKIKLMVLHLKFMRISIILL